MSGTERAIRQIVAHYEGCLSRHGDSHRGVDWPRAEDAELRYAVMLDLIPTNSSRPVRLLDFGCGAGHLLEFIQRRNLPGIEYHGLDISARFLALCRSKFPSTPFICADLLQDSLDLPEFDYIVMNGVFTEKRALSQDAMWNYARELLVRTWPHARHGLAFNVMSKQVDWERHDLFHLSCDVLLAFLKAELSRHCVIRHDYGLYEYTTYVYREANRWRA
jgi:SAM-dependent methyltransferase